MMADFWQNPTLEPKRAYKFVLSIPTSLGNPVPKFLVKKVSKPSFSVSESEHKFLNHTFYFPGKVTFNEVSFTIVDVIGADDGTATLMALFKEMGYRLPQSPDVGQAALQTISKARSVAAMAGVAIQQIDSEGATIEEWKLNNAWIKDVKFGDLDYDSEDLLNVEVTLRYDNANYSNPNVPSAELS
ncbi:MAG: hypothetical protein VYC14_03125 [Actinomycetota bacterium]|nr:hypothetical protein [Actinomycetota bacterium]